MHNSNRLNNLAEFDGASRGPVARNDTPAVLPRRGSARNDAACENPAIATLIVSAIRTVGAAARRARRRYHQRREARAIYDALQQLDDRTLHDLGIERGEISSVAAEATGQAAYTRAQTFCAVAR